MSTPLESLLCRVGAIEHAVGDCFPLFAAPGGDWTTTRRGSWTGGFWAGLLWLRTSVTGEPAHRQVAREWSRRLLPRAGDDTDTRAMTFWFGAGISGDPDVADVTMTGARAVAASASPDSGLIPVGTAFGGPPGRASVDSLAAIVALLDHAGLPGVAAAHTSQITSLLLTEDGTVRGDQPGRVWARGQAWGLLGFAVAACRLGDEFTATAHRVADRWLTLAGTGVPPAVFGVPGAPVDTSAAVIAAAGLWTLGEQAAANRIVDNVITGHLNAGGVLAGGCYDLAGGVACAHELIWGTFFLTALLALRAGRVGPPGW